MTWPKSKANYIEDGTGSSAIQLHMFDHGSQMLRWDKQAKQQRSAIKQLQLSKDATEPCNVPPINAMQVITPMIHVTNFG